MKKLGYVTLLHLPIADDLPSDILLNNLEHHESLGSTFTIGGTARACLVLYSLVPNGKDKKYFCGGTILNHWLNHFAVISSFISHF